MDKNTVELLIKYRSLPAPKMVIFLKNRNIEFTFQQNEITVYVQK